MNIWGLFGEMRILVNCRLFLKNIEIMFSLKLYVFDVKWQKNVLCIKNEFKRLKYEIVRLLNIYNVFYV